MSDFRNASGGSPFPRTEPEWIEKGFTPEQAKHRVAQDVFGHDYKTDAKGRPIEQGKGGDLQQTVQHLQAKQIQEDARGNRPMGWQPGLEFDPKIQAAIDEGIRAALKNRKKPGRKPKAKVETEPPFETH